MFTPFIQELSRSLQGQLPGKPAQYKMAPHGRALKEEALKENPHPKSSAVLVLLYPYKDKLNMVLMLRNEYDGVHSAQVSFPGGQQDEQDNSLEYTALREAEEEIGINKEEVQIIGRLSDLYIFASGFLVSPYVGYIPHTPKFDPDTEEVQALIRVPLSLIMDDSIVKETVIHLHSGNMRINAPYFDIEGHVVWGATAMMLSEFKAILTKLNV